MASTQPTLSTELRAATVGEQPIVHGHVGSWELIRIIGQGQLSIVYQARPAGDQVDRPALYAVKVLQPQWQLNDRGLPILAREVHVSRQVSSPHLAPILAARLDKAPYFVAMPLLQGDTLARRLEARTPVDLSVAFWIGRQVAQALHALHNAGWMHADVKPSNILIGPNGHATLIDLGFARATNEAGSIADRPIVGTLNYAAPEIVYSTVGGDIRSDVYSLGVTLFEILTGRLPFDAQDIAELAAQHRHSPLGDLRGLVPHLPTRGARLIRSMLAKEPLRRPMPQELIPRLAALEVETFAERRWQ
jgi:eukaryotic-like serine/threonine-protein kinase